jgi:hypothetical protein
MGGHLGMALSLGCNRRPFGAHFSCTETLFSSMFWPVLLPILPDPQFLLPETF